jgi:P27 family predicted phage terminase small subunit
MATMSQVEGWVLPTDLAALHEHCELYETLLSAKTELKKKGRVDDEGKVSAYWKVYKDANSMYMKSCIEFGCTPSSRSRINLMHIKGSEPDPMDKLKI